MGSEIVGTSLGGCVVSLVGKEKADDVILTINEKYHDKYGYEYKTYVYTASNDSCAIV